MTDRRARIFAGVLFFALFAGEAIRNTLSWYGFAVVVGVLAVTCAVILIRTRRRVDSATRIAAPHPIRSLLADPLLPLVAFLSWSALSVLWSAYPGGTLLGVAIIGCTTLAPAVIHRSLDDRGVTVALWWALAAIVTLSLAFETIVAIGGRPILPVFPIDVAPGERIPLAFYWSRAQLFEGGPIQGILGNSNLVAFVALLLVCTSLALWRAGGPRRSVLAGGVIAGVATVVLARSTTVLVTAVVVALVTAVAVLMRRRSTRGVATALIAVATVLGAAALLSADRVLAILGRSNDLTGRTDIWAAVGELFLERPVAGWGWTGYWQPWIPLFDGLAERRGVQYLQAHNAVLDAAFQLGVIGAAFLIWTLVLVMSRATAAARTDALPLALGTVLVVQSLTESRLLYEGNWTLLVLLVLMLRRRRSSDAGGPATPVS